MFSVEWRRKQFVRSVKLWLIVFIVAFILFLANLYSTLSYTNKNNSKSSHMPEQSSTESGLRYDESLRMDDPRVIKKLLSNFLLPPPELGPQHTYQLDHPEERDPSKGQSEMIRMLLQNKTNGVFIECGALDGETRSNTLYLERFLNWSGLLIEADPLNFAQAVKKNRKAWLSSSCLSKTLHPTIVTFKQSFNVGRISLLKPGKHRSGYVDIECFPLYSYLLALNISHVDYFSLDVEGDELDILKTLPFEKVDITTLSVEFTHVKEGKEALRRFMESKGYSVVGEVTHPKRQANDFIFMKNVP